MTRRPIVTRNQLPHQSDQLFLTDGGLETTLIFQDGVELPHFAAFILLKDQAGRELLARYYQRYLEIAAKDDRGFILESPTWRSNADWGVRLGLSARELEALNRDAIGLMLELRDRHATSAPAVVSGCIGPRGDGYQVDRVMTPEEAEAYHRPQILALRDAGAELITAITCTNTNEGLGVVRAAKAAELPAVISFTVETDGRLPSGARLREAIEEVDAQSDRAAAYFMINCAHPTHFQDALAGGGAWVERVRGVRANASRRSHQELNDAPDLDAGDPGEFGNEHRELLRRHPHINVLGGCCGTDHRHVACISTACSGGQGGRIAAASEGSVGHV
jgi:homocysteine S-methyltransferase